MKAEKIGELLGWALRFIGGAVAFGYWQHNIFAGIFAMSLLVCMEEK